MTQASMSTSRALFYSLAFGTALSLMPASAMAVQGGQCNNGIDDDGDGLVDYLYDMGCYGPDDPTEEGLPRNQENGWTTFNKSDTRIVYVSDSQGGMRIQGCARIGRKFQILASAARRKHWPQVIACCAMARPTGCCCTVAIHGKTRISLALHNGITAAAPIRIFGEKAAPAPPK